MSLVFWTNLLMVAQVMTGCLHHLGLLESSGGLTDARGVCRFVLAFVVMIATVLLFCFAPFGANESTLPLMNERSLILLMGIAAMKGFVDVVIGVILLRRVPCDR